MAQDRRNKVELGCGTLILIVLIVLIFSGGGATGDLKKQVKTLQDEVLVLEQKIDALTQAIEAAHQPAAAGIAQPAELPAAAQKSTSVPESPNDDGETAVKPPISPPPSGLQA